MGQNPILVERYRGTVLESFHRGVICMVDENGKVIFSMGDIQQVCYPRSALKLFQVIPLLESGAVEAFGFTTEEIALMIGSHNGEKEHLRVVHSILQKIGLGEEYLQCGAQYPTLTEDRNVLIKADKAPEDIHNNCSGKHAGFLALCVYAGYDTKSYLDPQHPVHQAIKKVVAEMNEYPESEMVTAVDGCSAPIFSLPVYNQALGYKNMVNPVKFDEKRQRSCQIVLDAMAAYPYMIAGKHRYCTEMMEVCGEHVIGKTGADGVYSLAFRHEKWGCTIKVDDGLMGPQYSIAQAIIERMHLCPEDKLAALHEYIEAPLYNWAKKQTGVVKVNDEIFSDLEARLHTLMHH